MESPQLQNLDNCLSCGEAYDKHLKQKVIIPCGDVYCLKCMSSASFQDDNFNCIVCEHDVKISQKFQENLQNLVSYEQKLQTTGKLNQGLNAGFFCQECETYACDQCIKAKHSDHEEFLSICNHAKESDSKNVKSILQKYSTQESKIKFSNSESKINNTGHVTQHDLQKQNNVPTVDDEYARFFSLIENQTVLDQMKQYPQVKLLDLKKSSENREIRSMVTLEDGSVYLGEWNVLTNKMEGKGMEIHQSGSIYSGEFKDGELNGYGILIYSNGNIYEGEWANDKRNGLGTFIIKDGGTYVGQWKDGLKEGQGVYTWPNGNRKLSENTLRGVIHGDPKSPRSVGRKYFGEYKSDKRNGHGVLQYVNGNRYEGAWLDDLFHGQGVYTWRDGSKYEGCCIDGIREGYGVLTYPDGSKYEGNWKNHCKHGIAKFTYFSGKIEYGEWKNGNKFKEVSEKEYLSLLQNRN
eukprot:403345580